MLPDCNLPEIERPDGESLKKGVPCTDRGKLIRLGDLWLEAAERLIPSIVEGFPKFRRELSLLQTAVSTSTFSPDDFLGACFGAGEEKASVNCRELGHAGRFSPLCPPSNRKTGR